MSFILDALKKSESDRQRQSGPALFEVKIAPPKARFPAWAVALVVLLGINLIIVAWLLLRPSHAHGVAATTEAAPAAAAMPAAGAAAASVNSQRMAPPAATTPVALTGSTPVSANGVAGPPTAPVNTAANVPAPYSTSPAAPAGPAEGMPGTAGHIPPNTGATPASVAQETGAAGAEPPPAAANPDDYAPATEPGGSVFKAHVRRGTESGYMLYQDAALVPGANLPQLRLDLHVYAARPQDRFALVNMHRLHEGDSLPEGVRVESIIPDGVVMSHNGTKFLLPRE